MTEDIKKFNTRKVFDENQWNEFVQKLHYTQGDFSDPEAYKRLAVLINATEAKLKTEGNTLFYMATPPRYLNWFPPTFNHQVLRIRKKAGSERSSKNHSGMILKPLSS